MVKKVVIVVTSIMVLSLMVLSLVFVLGCSAFSKPASSSSPGSIKILRETTLGSEWNMKQMNVEAGENGKTSVLLKLVDGNRVDGFFYLEKGEIEFSITGDSLIYESKGKESKKVISDRFSFTASRAQGSTYVLNFSNTNKQGKVTVFLEVIFPVTGSVFIPIETK